MANKYLDDSGLSRMWSKVKTYVSNNYATKSALSDGLAGKANSSHTHTSSQITDLQTKLDKIPTITKSSATANMLNNHYTLPSLAVGEIRFHTLTANQIHNNRYVKLPSGGTYGIIYEDIISGGYSSETKLEIGVYAGSSNIVNGKEDAGNYVLDFFYIRIS